MRTCRTISRSTTDTPVHQSATNIWIIHEQSEENCDPKDDQRCIMFG